MALTESQNAGRQAWVTLAEPDRALCVVLIAIADRQVDGAAVATSTALIVESVLLFLSTKRRLGFHVFIWGRS